MLRPFNVLFAIAAAALAAQGALAQITIEPATPKAYSEIRVRIPGSAFGLDKEGRPDQMDPKRTTVVMAGNKITISPMMVGGPDFATSIPTIPLDQTIGALPAGSYQIEVVKRAEGNGQAGAVGSTFSFTVAARAETDALANYSDIWYTPNEEGWGFNLIHHVWSKQIFGTLFVYGDDKLPVWFVMPEGDWLDEVTFTGLLYATKGPHFREPFSPSKVEVEQVGYITFHFNPYDVDRATIQSTIRDITFNKEIRRQKF